jgi:hypothetical protein
MDQPDLDALSAALRTVSSRTLADCSLTNGVFSGDRIRIEATVITLVARNDGTAVAFYALALMDAETLPEPNVVLQLDLVLVDPGERSNHLSLVLTGLTCFPLFFRKQFRPLCLSKVTRVPAVVGMATELSSDV